MERQDQEEADQQHRGLFPIQTLEDRQDGRSAQYDQGGPPRRAEPRSQAKGQQEQHQTQDGGKEVADLDQQIRREGQEQQKARRF